LYIACQNGHANVIDGIDGEGIDGEGTQETTKGYFRMPIQFIKERS
jgi:hypothetical protein